jgi:predicted Zn-dependent protease
MTRWLLPILCILLLLSVSSSHAGISIGGFSIGSSEDDSNIDFGKIFDTIKQGKSAFSTIDTAEEIELGKQAASVFLGAAPLSDEITLHRYINRLGYWLIQHTERPTLPWRFGVLDTDSINAFAVPGGYIFVTRGLIDQLDSEAELACVLAHEIAHVLRRHHVQAIKNNARFKLTGNLIGMAADNTNTAALDTVLGGVKELYARGLDKEDEFEADHMAMVIAARAGYDPYGLMTVLQKLDTINPDASTLALWFKTHPPPIRRLEALGETIGGNLEIYAGQFYGAKQFADITGSQPH